MLVDFSFKNYRIFREEHSFSMVPTARSRRDYGLYHIDTNSTVRPFLHRCATIYGANGSGKTSFINAMKFVRQLVRHSFDSLPFDQVEVHPFIYNTNSLKEPSKFEITFLLEDVLYRYGFTINNKQVLEEFLLERPPHPSRTRVLFHREFVLEEENYKWRMNSKFFKEKEKSLRSFTRPNALFLSTAVHFNNSTLLPIYKWLTSKTVYLTECFEYLKTYTARLCYDYRKKSKILNFFKTMDTQIEDIIVKSRRSQTEILNNKSFENFADNITDTINGDPEFEIYFIRKNNEGRSVSLRLEDESQGINTLFYVAARLLKAIENGRIVIIDEINTNMHPILFKELITMFDGISYPDTNAQLIFTSHDVTPTEYDCIGHDQIWMVERQSDLSSQLYPFTDVDVPSDVTFRRGYLLGRYGSTPNIVRHKL